jgi:hypothetical protein
MARLTMANSSSGSGDPMPTLVQWMISVFQRQLSLIRRYLPSQLFLFAVVLLLRKLYKKYLSHLNYTRDHAEWESREDMMTIQAALLSAEHVHELGRIEKRTLFAKPINEVFSNEHIKERVLDAATKTSPDHPIVPVFLSDDEKWHVLNTCTNHISSCFAPYHIFFNEGRKNDSYYRSAWYAFTMTCQRSGKGRFIVTPNTPVTAESDVIFIRHQIHFPM